MKYIENDKLYTDISTQHNIKLFRNVNFDLRYKFLTYLKDNSLFWKPLFETAKPNGFFYKSLYTYESHITYR